MIKHPTKATKATIRFIACSVLNREDLDISLADISKLDGAHISIAKKPLLHTENDLTRGFANEFGSFFSITTAEFDDKTQRF